MSELLLDSLEIKGYRCFEHLTIEKLGRVNLIVGKNNIGKTSLLEAIRIYAQNGKPSLILDLMESRNEISKNIKDRQDFLEPLENLFYGRTLDQTNKISIGKSSKDKRKLTLEIDYKDGESIQQSVLPTLSKQDFYEDSQSLVLSMFVGKDRLVSLPLISDSFNRFGFMSERRVDFKRIDLQFVQANGLGVEEIASLWDSVVLTELEDFATHSLRLISPEVDRISFRGEERRNIRIPIVKTTLAEKPIPLRSLGEGMSRILGISLSLANAKNGILIVDEIESGLHYSVLPDVWKLIFKTAKDLNVQVFATTHSDDCIKAFNEVANANDEKDDGMLIRLERQGDKIIAKTVVEERLALAIEHGVEMR
jgi:AAA15 family ATPase/GTPase